MLFFLHKNEKQKQIKQLVELSHGSVGSLTFGFHPYGIQPGPTIAAIKKLNAVNADRTMNIV